MRSYTNRYLIVPTTVTLTQELDDHLYEIDCEFREHPETVTSAVRTSEDQLRIIRKYLVSKNLDLKYPEAITAKVGDKYLGTDEYIWQKGWSALLNYGVIVNPPLPAVVMFDYYRNGVNKKGQVIGMSPHLKGKAYDLSGVDSLPIVKRLKLADKIKGFLLERENGCLHIDIF